MRINCVKPLYKSYEKSTQKSWKKKVENITLNKVFTIFPKFCSFLHSFTHFISTRKMQHSNLLNEEFYRFCTYTTNTTINIIRGF